MQLQIAVHQALKNEIPPNSVAADVSSLPLLWKIISTPEGLRMCEDGDVSYVGTGGGWPPQRYR